MPRLRTSPRRRAAIATTVVVLVASLAGLVAGVGWPRYRPALRPGESYGIDVSAHQGGIDWAAVARDGVSAAYVKATEGASWRDPRFTANWHEARTAGLRVGAYHYFTLCSDGQAQAANLLGVLAAVHDTGGPPPMAPVVDLEFGGNCSRRPPHDEVLAHLRTFIDRVEASTQQQVVMYVLPEFEDRYPLTPELDRPRWVRRLAWRPSQPWTWWQVNNRALVDGVAGPVDLDVVAAR